MFDMIRRMLPYLRYARPYRKTTIVIMIYILALAFLALVPPFIIRTMFDVIIPAGDIRFLVIALVGMVVAGTIIFAFSAMRDYLLTLVKQGITYEVQTDYYFHIMRLPQVVHDDIPFGEVMKRMEDGTAIAELQDILITDFYQNSIQLIAYLPAMFFINWQLSLIKLVAFPFSLLISRFFMKKDLEYEQKTWEAGSEVETHLNQTFQGIRVIKAFGIENRILRKMKQLILTQRKLSVTRMLFGDLWGFSGGIVGDVANSVVLFVAGLLMIGGHLTFGEFFAFNIIASDAIDSLNGLMDILKNITGSLNAVDRFEKLHGIPEEHYGKYHDAKDFRLRGEVVFDDVWFGYGSDPVLKGLSFAAHQGTKVALVGRSGAGKTTILNLLLKFYQASAGAIRIDGHSIDDLSVRQVRKNAAVVLQENYFFDGTILDNLTFGDKSIPMEKAIDALRKANAYDFISKLPNGPHTVYGSNGINLSGGQKQRLAIARAFLRDPAILLLDEATSALDLESERLVQEALAELMAGRTTITIAHRLSTIVSADVILVIDDGRVAESGKHDELLSQRGLYYELYTKMGVLAE